MSGINRLGHCSCSLLQNPNISKCANFIFVRFRKPRWQPKAPSKVFKVREPTPIDPVEYAKMKEWTSHYNTAMKSILKYLREHDERLNQLERSRNIIDTQVFNFNDEVFAEMMTKNDAWNMETARIREEDMAEKDQIEAIRRQKIVERDVRERDEIRQQAMKRVLDVKEWKDNYITEEDLDDAVEEVLNSRVDYNFALQPDGSKITPESKEASQSKT